MTAAAIAPAALALLSPRQLRGPWGGASLLIADSVMSWARDWSLTEKPSRLVPAILCTWAKVVAGQPNFCP